MIFYSQAGDLFEIFLISAVVSLISIRVYLSVTGYPQLGSGDFHIAHMLWGGFGMLVALLSLFTILNNEIKFFGAILGGIGFGTFIDELGKFITSDNNYFFQPSIALIYVIFVLIFLLARVLEKNQKLSDKEYIVNTLEIVKDIFSHDFDNDDKKRALKFLHQIDSKDPFIKDLRELIERVKIDTDDETEVFKNVKRYFRRFYRNLIGKNWFKILFFSFFVTGGLFNLIRGFYYFGFSQSIDFWSGGYIFSAAFSGLLIIIGLISLQNSRLSAYLWFKKGVLISLLLTQFFLFYKDQMSALVGLGVSLLFFLVIQYLIEQEKRLD